MTMGARDRCCRVIRAPKLMRHHLGSLPKPSLIYFAIKATHLCFLEHIGLLLSYNFNVFCITTVSIKKENVLEIPSKLMDIYSLVLFAMDL